MLIKTENRKQKTKNKKQMKQLKIMTVLFVLAIGVISPLRAQEPVQRISIEIDPSTFVFKGYGVHLRWQPKSSDHLLVGAGAYALNMPDFLVDIDKANRGLGWDVRLNQGYGLFGEYFFSEVNKKWFTGLQLGMQEHIITNSAIEGKAKYWNSLAMVYGGYSWQPFDFDFYIKPWAGVGYVNKVSGSNEIGDLTYGVSPLTGFATLHLGYTF